MRTERDTRTDTRNLQRRWRSRRRSGHTAPVPASSELIVHLVRHGETRWNLDRRIQGQTHDVRLTDRGREQAHELAASLTGSNAGALYSSDSLRAWETAIIIGGAIGLDVTPEPALREIHFGVLQGRLVTEIMAEVRAVWEDPNARAAGGESLRDLHARASGLFKRLTFESPHDEVIAVTHGGTMNVALAWAAGVPVEKLEMRRLGNCAIETVRLPRDAR